MVEQLRAASVYQLVSMLARYVSVTASGSPTSQLDQKNWHSMPAWKELKQRISAELCVSRSGELRNFICW